MIMMSDEDLTLRLLEFTALIGNLNSSIDDLESTITDLIDEVIKLNNKLEE